MTPLFMQGAYLYEKLTPIEQMLPVILDAREVPGSCTWILGHEYEFTLPSTNPYPRAR
jgi:hypothetical protein